MLKTKTTSMIALVSALFSGLLATQARAEINFKQREKLPPKLMLNEVMFDELGVDAESETEYIELYARQAVSLSQYRLRSLSGSFNQLLPSASIPAGSYVVIFLGSFIPIGFDQDPNDNVFAFHLNLPMGDYLGKSSAGIRLKKGNQTKDELSWGFGTPPSGAAAATFVDLTFGAGKSVRPGDSLGRNKNQKFTGKAADWHRHGGANACMPTAGLRNTVIKPNEGQMHHWVQTGINMMASGLSYGTLQPDWIQVTDANVTTTSLVEDTDSITVTGDHVLSVKVHGTTVQMSGSLMASFIRSTQKGNVFYSLSVQGTLVSPEGYGFEIDYTDDFYGFQTDTVYVDCFADNAWLEPGNVYDFDIQTTMEMRHVGVNAFEHYDDRTVTDWGGAGQKSSNSLTSINELSDGVFFSQFTMNRPKEMGPPPTWNAGNQNITANSSYDIDTLTTVTPQSSSGSITRFDIFEDRTLRVQLQDGVDGSFSQQISVNAAGDGLYASSTNLPVCQFGYEYEIGTDIQASTVVVGGKRITTAQAGLLVGGAVISSAVFYIDPDEEEGGRSLGGFFGAVGICGAAGAAVGAGAGAVVGGVAGGAAGATAGAAAGGVGAVPGAVAGAKGGAVTGGAIGGALGGLGGAIGCGIGYFTPWWD